jgi:hypothetical protein
LSELRAEREQGMEERLGQGAERRVGRDQRGVEGRDRLRLDVGPVVGVAGTIEREDRGDVAGDRFARRERRAERPALADVRMTEVLRYSSLTTVRSGIHGEMAMAGMRTPERSKRKPHWPAGAAGSGGGAGGGGTWS